MQCCINIALWNSNGISLKCLGTVVFPIAPAYYVRGRHFLWNRGSWISESILQYFCDTPIWGSKIYENPGTHSVKNLHFRGYFINQNFQYNFQPPNHLLIIFVAPYFSKKKKICEGVLVGDSQQGKLLSSQDSQYWKAKLALLGASLSLDKEYKALLGSKVIHMSAWVNRGQFAKKMFYGYQIWSK